MTEGNSIIHDMRYLRRKKKNLNPVHNKTGAMKHIKLCKPITRGKIISKALKTMTVRDQFQ